MASSRKDNESRQMVVRYADTSPATITEFGCSCCEWKFYIQQPAPGPVRAEVLEFAQVAYDNHACPGGTAVGPDRHAIDTQTATSCPENTDFVN